MKTPIDIGHVAGDAAGAVAGQHHRDIAHILDGDEALFRRALPRGVDQLIEMRDARAGTGLQRARERWR